MLSNVCPLHILASEFINCINKPSLLFVYIYDAVNFCCNNFLM